MIYTHVLNTPGVAVRSPLRRCGEERVTVLEHDGRDHRAQGVLGRRNDFGLAADQAVGRHSRLVPVIGKAKLTCNAVRIHASGYWAVYPPSIGKIEPVTQDDSSDAR